MFNFFWKYTGYKPILLLVEHRSQNNYDSPSLETGFKPVLLLVEHRSRNNFDSLPFDTDFKPVLLKRKTATTS